MVKASMKSSILKSWIKPALLLGLVFSLAQPSYAASGTAATSLTLAEAPAYAQADIRLGRKLLGFSGSYQEEFDRFYLLLDRNGPSVFPEPSRYLASALAFAPGSNESEMNFSWYSPATGTPGVIEYAKVTNQFSKEAEPVQAKKAIARLAPASDGYSANEAVITGLEPSAEYIYRFGDGSGKWTDTYRFHTRPQDSYNFLLMGDPQIGASGDLNADIAGWNDTLEKALEKFPHTSFIQSAGDQVETRYLEEEYDAYFAPEVLRQIPTATTVGNHDNTIHYEYHFNVPNQNPELGNYDQSGGNYYFTYGDALFINLNSNQTEAEQHIRFMEETAAATAGQDFKWKFVVLHHSIYSAAVHSRSDHVVGLREALVPVIDRLDIDAVLMGHDHSYVRTHQMREFEPIQNLKVEDGAAINPEGTVYLTGNSSSGSKFYQMYETPEPYAAVREQLELPTFMNVDVTPSSLEFTTYRTDTMEVVDTYKLIKDESIQVVFPALEDAELALSSDILATEPTEFYPEVKLDVKGTNVEGGPFDLFQEDITFRTAPEGQIQIAPTGVVTAAENASPGEVEVWAEVEADGKSITTGRTTISLVEHAETTLLEPGAEWTYLDDGSEQDEEWRQPDFDDSDWEAGNAPLGYPEEEEHSDYGAIQTEIGYGDDESDKHPVSYFRTSFNVDDPDAIGNLGLIDFAADDAAVVYLNGEEIGRYNLPEGEIPSDSYLLDFAGEDIPEENKDQRIRLDEEALGLLVEGENVLAVQVHQDSPQSSDVFWEMQFVTNLKTGSGE